MVIFYNLSNERTRDVHMVEHNAMMPTLPENVTMQEKIKYYKDEQNLGFICLTYEPGDDVFEYNLSFDDNGNFLGLIPKEN